VSSAAIGARLSRLRNRLLETARARPWMLVLPVVFTLVSGWYFASFAASPGSLGFDARLYSLAARAMLEGRNPWTAELAGGTIVGPPTTLIPYLPFAYLPQELSAGIWISGSFLIAAVILRELHLPPWWLAFPPFFHPLVLGNEEILMVGLLVLGGRRLAGLAPLLKPYALIPLVVERRWTAAALGAGLGLASLLFLPWATFVQSLPLIRERIVSQSFGDNAFGDPLLVAIASVALLSLGLARGSWFATPVLWPYAQTHYGLMALPIMPPLLGLIWALPIPEAITVGIVVLAVAEVVARNRGWTLERAPATGLAGWLRPPRRSPDWVSSAT
jgi:hypothetical protein